MVDRTSGNVINQMHVAHGTDNTTTTDIDESSAEVKAVWQAILADGGGTTAVGSYKASPAGAFDMAGNAYEFTRDWYTVSAYLTLAGTTTDPSIEDESTLTEADKLGGSDGDIDGNGVGQATRIIRGGSWSSASDWWGCLPLEKGYFPSLDPLRGHPVRWLCATFLAFGRGLSCAWSKVSETSRTLEAS